MDNNLDSIVKGITKKFGDDSIFFYGEENVPDLDIIPTGSITLNHALGTGGIAKGRITQIIGDEATGKTTLANTIIAEANKNGDMALVLDVEHTYSLDFAERYGVDKTKLIVSRPQHGEEALEIGRAIAETGEIGLIVLDSIAAMNPESESEKELTEEPKMAKNATMVQRALRTLVPIVDINHVAFVVINQYRMNLGGYGNPKIPTGGQMLKYAISQSIALSWADKPLDEGDGVIGRKIKAKIIKNKLAMPYKECIYTLYWENGKERIDNFADIFDLASDIGIINKAGGWYSYGTGMDGKDKKWRREDLLQYFKENKEEFDIITKQCGL